MRRDKMFIVMLSFSLLVTLFSCGKEEDVPPYVGEWWRSETIMQEGISLPARYTITFTESTFIQLVELKTAGKYIKLLKASGTMTATDTHMTVTLNTIAVTTTSFSGPTGTLISYDYGSDGFDTLLEEMGGERSYTSYYSVVGNMLIIDDMSFTRK